MHSLISEIISVESKIWNTINTIFEELYKDERLNNKDFKDIHNRICMIKNDMQDRRIASTITYYYLYIAQEIYAQTLKIEGELYYLINKNQKK